MGVNKFEVKTFNSFPYPVIHFKKQVRGENDNPLRINENKENPYIRPETVESINIHEIILENGERTLLREITEKIAIVLYPSWIDKNDFDNKIENILIENEKPEDVLVLNVSILCPKLNLLLENKIIPIQEITTGKPIIFRDIVVEDISDKIKIESELLRIKSSNPTPLMKAYAKWTILARNHDINFYIDEIERIGQNALEILPGETGLSLFVLNNMEPLGIEPPTLIYNKKFERDFTNGDNSFIIQTLLMTIGLSYIEALLKWISFGKVIYDDPKHYTIIRFLSNLTEINETDFKNVIEETSEESKKDFFLKSSNQLFKNIQTIDKGWNYFIQKFIENE